MARVKAKINNFFLLIQLMGHRTMPSDAETSQGGCKLCSIIRGDTQLFESNKFIKQDPAIPIKTTHFSVFPDAAPISPGHILFVPREHVLSIGALPESQHHRLASIIDSIAKFLNERYDNMVPYIFEHGSTIEDQEQGCSITHAHLHLFFAEGGLMNGVNHIEKYQTFRSLEEGWYDFGDEGYYLLGSLNGEYIGTPINEFPEIQCDQMLRKLFAKLLGKPRVADYLRYNDENAEKDDLLKEVMVSQKLLESIDLSQSN